MHLFSAKWNTNLQGVCVGLHVAVVVIFFVQRY